MFKRVLSIGFVLYLLPIGIKSALGMLEEVVLYECPKFTTAPNIDGKVDDTVWEAASLNSLPYRFGTETPEPAGSKSFFRVGFDEQSLYLSATFFYDSEEPLKRNHKGRDDPDLWMDDSTEIYFDPGHNGHFYKFIISSAGVVTDFYQKESGIDYSWNASGARIAAAIGADSWSVEMSVPWSDFGLREARARIGEIWGFEILRFSGKNWASWTVGASYARPEKFGFLCFGHGFLTEMAKLLKAVKAFKGEHWRIVSQGGVIEFSSPTIALKSAMLRVSRQVAQAQLNLKSLSDDKKRQELINKLAPLRAALDETAKNIATGTIDEFALRALLLKLSNIGLAAGEVNYEALISEVLADIKP